MKVFKFGGASVKDAASVKNVVNILKNFEGEALCVVISAMGKTTNKLEAIIAAQLNGKIDEARDLLDALKVVHLNVCEELFLTEEQELKSSIDEIFVEAANNLTKYSSSTYNFIYDQVICTGELASTTIVNAYLNYQNVTSVWLDARHLIKTNAVYREASVKWKKTNTAFKRGFDNTIKQIHVTQGFIGGDDNGFTTTLGREGSDFTAAIIANVTNAQSVSIWKDVAGILSADPKIFDDATFIPTLSYNDAIEMTYYGASVIHPKTIKPLQNKQIPLYVRPFGNVSKTGTVISAKESAAQQPPIIILKENQTLIQIKSLDFSFIAEGHLSKILAVFSQHLIKINLFQTAAIKVYACVNNNPQKIPTLITQLKAAFDVELFENLKMLTIRNYTAASIDKHQDSCNILLEQKISKTVQFVYK